MSKNQMVVMAVVNQGRTHAKAANEYGMSRSWVTKLVARYRIEGDQAFKARSRRPKTSPNRTDPTAIQRILALRHELEAAGLDAGPATIAWHLKQHHSTTVSISTIRRHLISAGLVTPEPKERPKSSYIWFQVDLPNEMWQTDMTHWRLANSNDAEILSWLDDHSRYALSVTAHQRVSTPVVVTRFEETAGQHGFPASVLSDNGMYYTTRFAGTRTGRNRFETLLAEHGIQQEHSRPNHPRTCGKVERFQQTLKKWLRAQTPAATLNELQAHLDAFIDEYNHRRPHRSLNRTTPATIYTRLPKAQPGTDPNTHYRIRHDHIDQFGKVTIRHHGRLHHIGIGRRHAHTPIVMLIVDRDIAIIINNNTGELLRHLTLDTTRDYQPQE